jgi:hypothetical protein
MSNGRKRTTWLAAGIWLCLTACARTAGAQTRTAFEPRALELLRQMVEAYGQLPALDQQTEFFSAIIPLASPSPSLPNQPPGEAAPAAGKDDKPGEDNKLNRTLRLRFARPNRLNMEQKETDMSSGKLVLNQWISDGKRFWTYIGEKNWYTKEKAPGNAAGFARLEHLNSGSLELLMLMGINPFADIKEKADSVRWEGSETVRGVSTDVIVLRTAERFASSEARFYIGKDDHLLRRVVTETTPVQRQTSHPGRVGDALDELANDAPLPQPQLPPNITSREEPPGAEGTPMAMTRVSYENDVHSAPNFDADAFTFTIPTGALLYGPSDLTPKAHRQKQIDQIVKSLRQKNVRDYILNVMRMMPAP